MKTKRILVTGLLGLALAAAAIAGTATASNSKATVTGAGSTWVYPLVSLWATHYGGAHINYNSIGSGGGIQAISNRQVDFGASDAPLTKDQFAACHGCVQIPWALGGTSVPYHIKGLPNGLHITGKILAGIYLGKITHWNAKAIKKVNKGVHLPHLKITPVYRSDGSGTTYNFTDYLSKVSKAFRSKVGRGIQVNFPAGIGARGSSGVSAALGQTDGAVAYVDVAYSIKNGFSYFKVQNRAGKFIRPTVKACNSARQSITRVPKSNALHIVDPPKRLKRAYPICTFSYAILPTHAPKATALRKFVAWAVSSAGQKVAGAQKEQYVPIGTKVRNAALSTLSKIK